ncbi:MAG TPA: hypothetical protein VGI58_13655 [Streptosporangiaceae bacterium]
MIDSAPAGPEPADTGGPMERPDGPVGSPRHRRAVTPGSEARWASLVRAGYGAVLVCLPGPLIAMVTGKPVTSRTVVVARVLGVRHLAQAAICGLVPAPGVVRAGAAVDGLHAASMLAAAAAEPGLRRATLADSGIATAFASAALATLRR